MTMDKPLVLVVDDDDSIREIAQLSLELVGGWRTLLADGGEAALEQARTHRPDVILLDVMMPVMDGIETFHHLRADERTRDIPVILVTARDREVDKVRVDSRQLPSAFCFRKPGMSMWLGHLFWQGGRQ